MDNQPGKEKALNISIGEKEDKTLYSNEVISSFNADEFILDFLHIHMFPLRARLQARLALTPSFVKKFHDLLSRQISEYETKHGAIKKPEPLPKVGFQPEIR